MASALNPYVWELYLGSLAGELALTYFEGLTDYASRAQHEWPGYGIWAWLDSQHPEGEAIWDNEPLAPESADLVQRIQAFASRFPVSTPAHVQELLTQLVTSGTVQLSADPQDLLDAGVAMEEVHLISLGLYLAHPDTFVPYGFRAPGFPGQHQQFLKIAEAFGLPLPPVAAKKDTLGRWLYLGAFSTALQEFRAQQGWTMPELLAFLYHFAVVFVVSEARDDLPDPRHAWLLVGGGEEDGDFGDLNVMAPGDITHWQGSLDMQRGDVAVMYLRTPVKAVHSLVRVMDDAYVDPFFHYKHAVQIGALQKVPPVSFQALKNDPVFGASQHIGRNLQGASGQLLSQAEYNAVLGLLAAQGMDLEAAPRLPEGTEVDLTELANERDVEWRLVEPLLARLGLGERDWTRQLPVRMGRGERNYPDYAIGVTGIHPEVRVHALVEVKYRASGERAWKEAFYQAKSYGLRLGAKALLVAAADGLQLYHREQGDFTFGSGQAYRWHELSDHLLVQLRRALSPR